MTEWDQIYKDFRQGGVAWATLDGKLNARFKKFAVETEFLRKSVLDIGCGTGNYLEFLSEHGFEVAGIDSSKTAIAMTRDRLGDKVTAEVEDMFDYRIPPQKHDLIISFSTIHHGRKPQIRRLWEKIYQALLPDGTIFITLPSKAEFGVWRTFKNRKQIAPGTFVPLSGPEKGLPHSFFSKNEAFDLSKDFNDVSISKNSIGLWEVVGTK